MDQPENFTPLPRPGSTAEPDTPAVQEVSGALWLDGLRSAGTAAVAWLWHGYLAPGNLTLLTSQWKTGKTTLIAVLLARLKAGGTFAGLPLRAGKAAVVSEEHAGLWLRRSEKLDFGTHVCWFCRPFRGRPTAAAWRGLIDRLLDLRRRHGIDLVVIDALAAFLPGRTENDAAAVLDALLPLQRLTEAGLAVLLTHHPRKKASPEGQLARGSGALSGFADILIEMHPAHRSDLADRRRRLQAFSRFDDTLAHWLIELNAAGTDYAGLGAYDERCFTDSWQALERIFANARRKLTRHEVWQEWPDDTPRPVDMTLYRWLQRAVAEGRLCREGAGTKTKPFRYWVKGREKYFREHPVMELEPLGGW